MREPSTPFMWDRPMWGERPAVAKDQPQRAAERTDPRLPPAQEKCGPCTSGLTPCLSCSGEVAPRSAAEKALEWGVWQANARPGISGFWKTALAADAYSRSGARSSVFDEFVAAVSARAASPIDPALGPFAAYALPRIFARIIPPEVAGDPEDELREWLFKMLGLVKPANLQLRIKVTTGDVGGKLKCCPQLEYPIEQHGPSARSIRGGASITFGFTAQALYSDEAPCECDCCLFTQYINVSVTITPFGGQGRAMEGWVPCRVRTVTSSSGNPVATTLTSPVPRMHYPQEREARTGGAQSVTAATE